MKIIDVCHGYAGSGCLKQYYEKNSIQEYLIIPIGNCLSMGDLEMEHLSFVRKVLQIDNYNYQKAINKLLNSIKENTQIRIWSSKKNDNDYILFLYLCNLLKDKKVRIHVIFCTDYDERISSIDCLDYKIIQQLLKYEKVLSKKEILIFSNEWNELVEANSELRVIENGKIQNKYFSDYYDVILKKLKMLAPCTIANLIGELMIEQVINDAGDMLYLFLIDRLIDLEKIKITKKGERHFVDYITLNK